MTIVSSSGWFNPKMFTFYRLVKLRNSKLDSFLRLKVLCSLVQEAANTEIM